MERSGLPVDHADDLGPVNQTWAIFLISVLGLFLEMLLIRWIGTEVRIFAYLQNTILVVVFWDWAWVVLPPANPSNCAKRWFPC